MQNITLQLPDDVFDVLAAQSTRPGDQVCLAAALTFCRQGKLSTSQAARMAGLTYADFLEAAVRAGLDLYSPNLDELAEEIDRGFTLGRQHLAGHSSGQGGPT